jgi:hypothetical protein
MSVPFECRDIGPPTAHGGSTAGASVCMPLPNRDNLHEDEMLLFEAASKWKEKT